MTTLHLGSKTWVLLNSSRVASEIIAKRSKVTNERPHMPIAGGLVSNYKRAAIRRGPQWNEGRRVMHYLLNGSSLKQYGEWQELESLELLVSYLKEPQSWYSHHFRYSTSVFHRIVMGGRLRKSKLELDDYQRVTMEFVGSLGKSYVDFFPNLDKLPKILQFWRSPWEKMGKFHRRVFWNWWEPVAVAVRNGTAPASFVRDVLLNPETGFQGSEEDAMYLATSVMAAGGDNIRMTLNTFAMAVICYPDIFLRARAEVDMLCGEAERLPSMSDMSSMPYLAALIKEVLRWRPTVPLVPPHELTEDLEFEGYYFPKETSFVINTEAICREFLDPEDFQPERWMDGDEGNVLAGFWGFGGGRRVCVGYKVAQQTLFLAFARLIQSFDFVAVIFSPPSINIDSSKG